MYYMSGLPSTKHGNECVFVVVDKFSNMAIMAACKKNITAEATAKLFFERVWVHFGIPQSWGHHLGTNMISRPFILGGLKLKY